MRLLCLSVILVISSSSVVGPASASCAKNRQEPRLLLLLFLVVLVVLGSVIEVRVRLLPFSVPVPRARVVPLLDARPPVPGVMCCVERRGAPGCWELGAGRMGSVVDRLLLLLVDSCACARPAVLPTVV